MSSVRGGCDPRKEVELAESNGTVLSLLLLRKSHQDCENCQYCSFDTQK